MDFECFALKRHERVQTFAKFAARTAIATAPTSQHSPRRWLSRRGAVAQQQRRGRWPVVLHG
jgi:hypothetical protein